MRSVQAFPLRAFVVAALLLSAAAASADDQVLPTALQETAPSTWDWLAPRFFPAVPLLAGILGAVFAASLHVVKTAGVARAWRGGRLTRGALWFVPLMSALAAYVALVGAALVTGWSSSEVFATYVRDNAGFFDVVTILAGAVLVTGPWMLTFILPAPRPSSAHSA